MNMDLKKIKLILSDEDIEIRTDIVKSVSFLGVARKYKDEDLIGVLKIDENMFIAFVEE
tara:strand:- start:276 stop:452 length:177 start_codon:yes stop_codon:yes gene_type:complete